MKLGLAIGFALLVILLGLAFYKYEKFIPNLAPIHPALSAQEIEEINKTKPVTTIEVFKQQWQLKLKHHDQIIRSYPIRLGFNPMGINNLKVMVKHQKALIQLTGAILKVLIINLCISPIQIRTISLMQSNGKSQRVVM